MGVVLADLAFFRLATPAPAPELEFIENDLVGLAADGALGEGFGPTGELSHDGAYDDFGGFVIAGSGTLSGEESASAASGEVLAYIVREGDTLSDIAEQFGISSSDIRSANDKGTNLIRPGDELVIVPVSKGGAARSPSIAEAPSDGSESYFTRPVSGGINWGVVHDTSYMPAVDFSKACDSSVYAAAEGRVIRVGDPALYNSGYGGYILITHSNGARTLYAHTSENLVAVGDEVDQGELIAKVGNTGKVHGPTGCHVHFGVAGISNPFAR